MKKLLMLLLVMIMLVSCQKDNPKLETKEITLYDKIQFLQGSIGELPNQVQQFASKTVSVLQSNNNEVYSPLSFYHALTLLIPMAQPDDLPEILQLLNISDVAEFEQINQKFLPTVRFKAEEATKLMTNSLWVDQTVNPSDDMINTYAEKYFATLGKVDFKQPDVAKKQIEDFINRQTDNLIKKVDIAIDDEVKTILLNTLLYKGQWNKEMSLVDDFLFNNERVAAVSDLDTNPVYVENDLGQFYSRPYMDSSKMVFIKPKNDVNALITEKNMIKVFETINQLDYAEIQLDFIAPKVSVDSRFDHLKELVQFLGLVRTTSDSSTLTLGNSMKLKVDQIVQQAHLELDEKGTKAAAYTEIVIKEATAPAPDPVPVVEMHLDEPYLMILLDVYNNPMFITVVRTPQ